MSLKFTFLAVCAIVTFQGSHAIGICAPKFGLPPLSVALPMPLGLGMSCADAISNCGPEPLPLPIIQAPPVTVPTVEGPIIPLPSPPIPCPKTIAHKCICTKTVVKPQLIQRCITIPTIQRYLKRTYTPVVENIAYKAKPRCPPCGCGARVGGVPVIAPRAGMPLCGPPPPPMTLALPFSRIC